MIDGAVTLGHVVMDIRAGRAPRTTAHAHLYQFYREKLTAPRRRSLLEQIRSAPSPFSVATILADAELLGLTKNPKNAARWRRAAEARRAELRGELYVGGGA